MKTWINPYLTFKNSAREAMTYYQGIFGGDLQIATFGDFNAAQYAGQENLVMHSHLQTEDGWTFMAADSGDAFNPDSSIELAIGADNNQLDKANTWFDALADGGTISMPITKAPWGDHFGSLTDRYGVKWMFNIAGS